MANNKPNLLIVDDININIFALKQIVEHLDIEIATASSGPEAIEATLRSDFFLILMDIQMPGMNGIEASCKIHENANSKDTPIIFVSAVADDDQTLFDGYASGAFDFICKPVIPEILISKVIAFLSLWEQRKSVERLNRQLIQSNEQLHNFAHIVSHDIKTPMRQVSQLLDIVLEDKNNQLSNESLTHLKRITATSQHLISLVDGVLDYTTIGSSGLSFQPTNLMKLIESVLNDIIKPGDDYDISVDFNEKIDIFVDPRLTYQVFLNILENSIKYQKKDKKLEIKITLEANEEVSGIKYKSGYITIAIHDNGIGFDPKHQEDIFDPFKRLVSKNQYSGSGIGLGTTKKIISCHNGLIRARSQTDIGTSIYLSLPVTMPSQE